YTDFPLERPYRPVIDVPPSEHAISKMKLTSESATLLAALELADRCVRFDRPALAIPLMKSDLEYAKAGEKDLAIGAYFTECTASVLVLDANRDSQVSGLTRVKAASHKSFTNASLDVLVSMVEAGKPLNELLSSDKLSQLQKARELFELALQTRSEAG